MNYQDNNRRSRLLEWLSQTLVEVSGETLVAAALAGDAIRPSTSLIAIGKAAPAMACGALRAAGTARFGASLVITKTGHATPWHNCLRQAGARVIESGHPVPDARSLDAGAALLELLARTGDADLLLLLSGGASSLVEVLPPGVTLDALRRANTWLLGSGWDIARVNAVRRRLSSIKGGGLLAYVGMRRTRALLLSDVLGDDPAAIGSGLVTPVPDDAVPADLPDWLAGLLRPRTSAPADPGVDLAILAGNRTAREAFARRAQAAGVAVTRHETVLTGDARETGERIARRLLDGAPGVHVWGGETTVRLPDAPGVGGRNQHLALAAARILAGNPRVALLAAGTDGSDGPTDDAGALVDGGTVERGRLAGLDPLACLVRADAGRFLEASGDLVSTGPTGTNLNDLLVGWVQDARTGVNVEP